MQIDFHHATSASALYFDNRAMYFRTNSYHKTFDPDNLDDPENHLIWIHFHSFPGNNGLAAGANPAGKLIEKIICRAGSPATVEMLNATKGKACSLHRLGITMHVYVDTYAHQGFADVLHDVNCA